MQCGGTGATRAVIYLTLPELLNIAERTGGRVGRPGHRAAAVSAGTAAGNRVLLGRLPGSGGQGGILPHQLSGNYVLADGKERLALPWPVLSLP